MAQPSLQGVKDFVYDSLQEIYSNPISGGLRDKWSFEEIQTILDSDTLTQQKNALLSPIKKESIQNLPISTKTKEALQKTISGEVFYSTAKDTTIYYDLIALFGLALKTNQDYILIDKKTQYHINAKKISDIMSPMDTEDYNKLVGYHYQFLLS